MSGKRNPAKEAWHHLYNNKRWRARRAQQLAVEPLCRKCAERNRTTAATVADHIVPHKGNEELFWHGALQSLCERCHAGPKQTEERRGYSPTVGADGIPIDPAHPWWGGATR